MRFSICRLAGNPNRWWVQVQIGISQRNRRIGPDFRTYDEAAAHCLKIKPRNA